MYLYSWGANSHGQLGLDKCNEQIEKPTEINLDTFFRIRQIACGGGHTLLTDNEGQLYGCGWNSKHQLGINEEIHSFKRIWPLSGITFTNIACGWNFSCGVTDDHFLFVWGSNSHGQLGLPISHFNGIVKPVRLHVKACSISMGLRHTAIINTKGEVWVTGHGKYGQLGLGNNILSSDRFMQVTNIGKMSHIACGQNHTICWSSEEKALYVWGDNKHGQLLLSSDKYKNIFIPQKIDIDVKQEVKKLLSGWTNALLWLENGSLLSWGRNNYGQLGTDCPFEGKITHISLPDSREVQDVALGSEHTICLATDNTLWAWGWNEHANTGTQLDAKHIPVPTSVPLELKVNEKITQIYAGAAVNFFVSIDIKNDHNDDENNF